MADKRQYGGFVSQDEDGLLLWTYGTMRPFYLFFNGDSRPSTLDLFVAKHGCKLGHLGCYKYNKPQENL